MQSQDLFGNTNTNAQSTSYTIPNTSESRSVANTSPVGFSVQGQGSRATESVRRSTDPTAELPQTTEIGVAQY